MNLPAVALELAAATVLLLYAVSLVKKGVETASGDIVARNHIGDKGRKTCNRKLEFSHYIAGLQ
ncbi:hypothetical protein [Sinorhizobium sp. 6-117]|uniref:hypothetical protein n=1 Tax=Sinorhizobium sp. 6-117 TaxID=3049090 RepID=UPI0024C21FAA|nr:hypothetical protein [Sinorhizobium sp. 6-117]MDK1483158.1 hypothetical protein [Sinorhizobium sp. 6-117]